MQVRMRKMRRVMRMTRHLETTSTRNSWRGCRPRIEKGSWSSRHWIESKRPGLRGGLM